MRTIQLKITGFTPEQLASHARLLKAVDEMRTPTAALKTLSAAFGTASVEQFRQQIKERAKLAASGHLGVVRQLQGAVEARKNFAAFTL